MLKKMNSHKLLTFSRGKICWRNVSFLNIGFTSRHLWRSLSTAASPEAEGDVNHDTIEEKDKEEKRWVSPLKYVDYFDVKSMFTIKNLFDARVHYGHKEGSLDPRMRPYIFGSRLGHLIIDLEQTADHLYRALNFLAHMAYRGGIILFASNYHQHCHLIEKTAIECKEYAHTREVLPGLLSNSEIEFQTTIRLPDVIVLTCTLNDVLAEHPFVIEAARMNIPTVGVVDTNSNPNLVTYPIPGNDDSVASIELYCRLFKEAILKGKAEREKDLR